MGSRLGVGYSSRLFEQAIHAGSWSQVLGSGIEAFGLS